MADNESGQLRAGFHPLEAWGGGVRWTGPEAKLVLAQAGERKCSVTFHAGLARRGQSVRGRVQVGDEAGTNAETQEFEVAPDGWHTVVVPVPEGAPDPVWVTITVDDPIVPSALDKGSTDNRSLGVAVREVGLT